MGDSSASVRGLPASTWECEAVDAAGGGADERRRPSSTVARVDRGTSESTDSVEFAGPTAPRAATTGGEAPPFSFAPGAYGVAPGSAVVRMAKPIWQERSLACGLDQSTMEHHEAAISSPTSATVLSLTIHELPNPFPLSHLMPTPSRTTRPTAAVATDSSATTAYYQAEAVLAPSRPTPALTNSPENAVRVVPAVPVTETATVDPQKAVTKVPIYATLVGVLLLLAGIGVGVGVGMSSATNAPAARLSSTPPTPATSTVSDHARGSDSKQASKLIHGDGIT
jgi:hypothetical protein